MKKKIFGQMVAMLLTCLVAVEYLTGCGSMRQETAEYEEAEEYEEPTECEEAPACESSAEDGATLNSRNGNFKKCQEDSWTPYFNSEEYASVEESGFKSVVKEPLSTFSADVDTASYANLRRMIMDGCYMDEIPSDAVRIEEMINYFDYGYQEPTGKKPFSTTVEIGDCPWNEDSKLMMVGMQTQKIDFYDSVPSNLVFLLDVSGSMYDEDKLPLLQKSFSMLTKNLTAKDCVSIVTYAGSDEILLEGAKGSNHELITETLNNLEAGGATAGSEGIKTAYEIAEDYFIEGGNNRVILATDGDLNVGLTTEDELEKLITAKRESGVFLSVLGFGTGNIKDNKMELLADKGNGNYAYIDSAKEAKKVLVKELGATLVTVAKDVKFQVEFNPEVVTQYRLIGYDNRLLAAEDFEDDTKDAGEIGAGHSVTALYEIITKDSPRKGHIDLKYQDEDYEYERKETSDYAEDQEWLTVSVRYKEPDKDDSKLLEYPIDGSSYYEKCSRQWNFACAVAEFGMLLKDSDNKGDSSFRQIMQLLDNADTNSDEYQEEFEDLVNMMRRRED